MGSFGTVSLLGLPIGNPGDISFRVLEALKSGKYLICEDTRKLKNLLSHFDIKLDGKSIISFHDHSSDKKLEMILELTQKGEDIYYCSDAGSPIISDPGYSISNYCVENNIEFNSLSGISSVIAALELSGLPPIPFSFHGFLGRDRGEILSAASKASESYGTHIYFESKHRLGDTLKLFTETMPEAKFVVLRELTKEFQTVHRFIGKELADQEINYRGEFIFMVHNNEKPKTSSLKVKDLAAKCLEQNGKKKALSKLLAAILDEKQNDIFMQLSEK